MYSIEIKENTEKGALHVTVRIKKEKKNERSGKKKKGVIVPSLLASFFFFLCVVYVRDKQCHYCATFQ